MTLNTWDDQALVRLAGHNPAMQQRLLAKFLTTSADTLAALSKAHDGQDWAEVGRLAHSLKSAARSVGAMALGEHCFALEQAGKCADVQGCEALVRGLPDVAEPVFSLIRERVQARVAGVAAVP